MNDASISNIVQESEAAQYGYATSVIIGEDPLAFKCVVRANRRRNLPETYTEPLEAMQHEDPDVNLFLRSFKLFQWKDDIVIALAKYPDTLAIHFEQYVLNGKIAQEDFWCRYFYKCDEKRILNDLRRKDKLGILGTPAGLFHFFFSLFMSNTRFSHLEWTGQSSRNILASPNAAMGNMVDMNNFARGPPLTRGPAASSRFTSKEEQSASLNGSYSSLVADKPHPDGVDCMLSPTVGSSTPRRSIVGDVGSLKEKLGKYLAHSGGGVTSPVAASSERAQRYRRNGRPSVENS
jgi:hypothetical protein